MKKNLPLLLVAAFGLFSFESNAQRYVTEVFSDNEISFSPDITFGTNIDFLTSNLASPNVPAELLELQTLASTTGEYPSAYYNPADLSTGIKITNLNMDLYYPNPEVDDMEERPLMIYVHTGNFLPPPLNGSPNGLRTDSLAVVACTQWAKRGFVAASVSYRLGWNPIAESVFERRGTLLNAVYRAIHDVKQSVRFLRENAAGENTYGIDSDKIVLFGEGSGGYVVLAYATLDNNMEVFEEQFINPITQSSFVDTTMVGDVTGLNGQLNLYRDNGFSSEINMVANAGGALGDIDWLGDGDPAMVSFHAVRDDFAPFDEGTVIVPTTMEDVVDVVGANVFMPIANSYGNNNKFIEMPEDPYTSAARSRYGDTYEISNSESVTINENAENLFPVILELRPFMANVSAPWQWWDPSSPLATAEVAPGVTAHMASLNSNPNMSPTFGRTYLDTINGYLIPRVMCQLELEGAECGTSSISENHLNDATAVYPNPASDMVIFENQKSMILSFEIFDVTGKLVKTQQVNSFRTTLNTSGFSPGLYHVKFNYEGGIGVKKLIKN